MKKLPYIVKEYLDKIGADGLRCKDCPTGCTKENLFLQDEALMNDCREVKDAVPGYFVKCKQCGYRRCNMRNDTNFIFIDKDGDCGCIKRTKPRAKKEK